MKYRFSLLNSSESVTQKRTENLFENGFKEFSQYAWMKNTFYIALLLVQRMNF